MHESRRPPVPPVRRPWLWLAMAVVAVAAIGVSTLHFVTACAAAGGPALQPAAFGQAGPPLVNTVTQGRAFFYNPGSGKGSCSFGRLAAGGLYVSLGAAQYAAGAACGSYLDVTGPAGTVRAEVVDNCPGCSDGGIDMSAAAFSRVANPSAGTVLVSYQLARDPRLPGPLAVRVAQSASSTWLAVQLINQGNPLASVQVGTPHRAGWRSLTLSPDDYWVAPSGAGAGPFRVRVTDIFGHRVVLGGIRLAPGAVQRTSVLMYTAGPGSAQQSAAAGPAVPAASGPAPARAAGPAAARSGAGHAAGRGQPASGPGC
jgi:expansin (peptidoglycan-binding protein)